MVLEWTSTAGHTHRNASKNILPSSIDGKIVFLLSTFIWKRLMQPVVNHRVKLEHILNQLKFKYFLNSHSQVYPSLTFRQIYALDFLPWNAAIGQLNETRPSLTKNNLASINCADCISFTTIATIQPWSRQYHFSYYPIASLGGYDERWSWISRCLYCKKKIFQMKNEIEETVRRENNYILQKKPTIPLSNKNNEQLSCFISFPGETSFASLRPPFRVDLIEFSCKCVFFSTWGERGSQKHLAGFIYFFFFLGFYKRLLSITSENPWKRRCFWRKITSVCPLPSLWILRQKRNRDVEPLFFPLTASKQQRDLYL